MTGRGLWLVALVVVAGCVGAPTTAPPEGEAVLDGSTIDVRDGDLPVDANRTFAGVRSVLGADVEAPGYVRVLEDEDVPDRSGGNRSRGEDRSFRAVMGVVSESGWRSNLSYRYLGSTGFTGVVSVYPGRKPAGLVETILAHELVHYVQFQRGYVSRLRSTLPVQTTEGSYLFNAVVEGMAAYATDHYVDRYVETVESNSQLYRTIRASTPPGSADRYGNSVYLQGVQYFRQRLSDPDQARRVVADPPRTGEQLLHGYAPGEEPPRPLSTHLRTGDRWRPAGSDRMGEPFLRVALQNGRPERAAARVAAGWGNDSLQILRSPGGEVGYAWTVRWDDPANATEFARSIPQYLQTRGNRSGEFWRVDEWRFALHRVAPETTVLVVGNESFVRRTTVEGTNATVELSTRPDPREKRLRGHRVVRNYFRRSSATAEIRDRYSTIGSQRR